MTVCFTGFHFCILVWLNRAMTCFFATESCAEAECNHCKSVATTIARLQSPKEASPPSYTPRSSLSTAIPSSASRTTGLRQPSVQRYERVVQIQIHTSESACVCIQVKAWAFYKVLQFNTITHTLSFTSNGHSRVNAHSFRIRKLPQRRVASTAKYFARTFKRQEGKILY